MHMQYGSMRRRQELLAYGSIAPQPSRALRKLLT